MDNFYADIYNEMFTLNKFTKDYLNFMKTNNILEKMENNNILTKYEIFELTPYTDMIIRTINIPDIPSYNILMYIKTELLKNVNNFFGNSYYTKKLELILIRSFIYRLLDRAGLYNLNNQRKEELQLIGDKNTIDFYKKKYEKFLQVTIGKFYEIFFVNIANNHGLNVVYNNSRNVYSAHNLFKTPIVDLVHKSEWEDFDSYSTEYDAGFDIKVGTVYRNRLPTELYVSNTGFTETNFKKYLAYNGKTINKRVFIATIIPELTSKLIIYKKSNEYEFIKNEKYYFSKKEDIIYFIDVETFLEMNKYFRMTIPYMDKEQFCIPIKVNGDVSYLYNFYKFKEQIKTNSLQNQIVII